MVNDTQTTSDRRFDNDGDWMVREMIDPADLALKPEEYVARHAHLWGSFSFHLYRFTDPDLGAWVRRVGELLRSDEAVARCRQECLSPTERVIIEEQAAQGF